MKVKIGPYKYWFGPYQLAELLMFWVPKEKDKYGFPRTADRVHKFGEWLAYGSVAPEPKVGEIRDLHRNRPTTWLYKFLQWIDNKKKRTIKVRIDRWDTWSMDHTLAHIILPMLKQLKEIKQGAPYVDLEEVPKELHGTKLTQEQKDNGEVDDKHFERWDWALDEMIFAFESIVDESWEDQFYHGEHDSSFVKREDGNYELVHGPNHSLNFDVEGYNKYNARIDNGLQLFGKYYRGLWC